ncbi:MULTISPECIES: metallophosphoesterase [Metallosphaera]|uniref:Phosphoesterase n=3 Tax=Metallosphaera TaxID=41980 RepID=A4YF46_METS5|nr:MULTISPECIES: metallophosphoesterase [Metallosphaera]ABP95048.1 phosphoesterase [Metallosphaera sedula DSM 5348]AIM27034.1 phosphoesterase [Metallosphaera sedula]AKV73952.1 phosphoesterase [Metallosphaera sedula]AKV76191.1 phosphoesterase [Metallosphaera sedula]AKV78443.1 phosphoesterase [Metallosphaera sedula]
MPLQTKILFTSDIHGSETAFRKSLNAAKMYDVNYLVYGGDMFSKDFIFVMREGGDYYVDGKKVNLEALQENYMITGRMPIIMSKEELDFTLGNREALRKVVLERLEAQVDRWVKIQREKMENSNFFVVWNLGNDDPLELDSLLNSYGIETCQGKVIELGDLKMICEGFVNPTPFQTYREVPDSTLYIRLERLIEKVNPKETVLNVHVPPFNTKLDLAVNERKERSHVGSRSVHDLIQKYQPLVGLHGHIHESPGVDKIGETKIANPGSEYQSGIFRGVLVVIERQLEKGLLRSFKVKAISLIHG